MNRIKALVLDIDGVLTDGKVYIDEFGREKKTLCFTDFDYLKLIQMDGILISAVTGENTPITLIIKDRITWDFFQCGCKDKVAGLKKIARELNVSINDICYVGDGFYDVKALELAGIGICPANATREAKRKSNVVLEKSGGEGCVEEIYERVFVNNNKTEELGYEEREILDLLLNRYEKLYQIKSDIVLAYSILKECVSYGGRIITCGNGGSSADADHMVAELMKSFLCPRKLPNSFREALADQDKDIGTELAMRLEMPIPAFSLMNQLALTTATSNDVGYEYACAQQLVGLGKSEDVLVAITTSGNSKNIVNAACTAKAMGIKVVGLTGMTGGKLYRFSDVIVKVPEKDTYLIQELHLPIYHCWCQMIEAYYMISKKNGL